MARYAKHIIRYGETLQSIASKEMGDANSWYDIAKYNDLQYPYVVDTDTEKKQNMEHLVTLGDIVIIPIPVGLNSLDKNNLTTQDKLDIERISLGQDLSMVAFTADYSNKGTDEQIMELSDNGQGDLATVSGVQNIKQVAIAHILTAKGSLLLHPEYGSGLIDLFKTGTPDHILLIDDEISKALLSDSRIVDAKKTASTLSGTTYSSTWNISIEGIDTQLAFIVGRDETGNFIIQ